MIEILVGFAVLFALATLCRSIMSARKARRERNELLEYVAALRSYSNGNHISIEEWRQAAHASLEASLARRGKEGNGEA